MIANFWLWCFGHHFPGRFVWNFRGDLRRMQGKACLGGKRPAWRCCLTFPLITLAALILIYLLVNGHYEVSFVYGVTSNAMPLYLRVTALWGGQAGSLVFWSWLMSAFARRSPCANGTATRNFCPG